MTNKKFTDLVATDRVLTVPEYKELCDFIYTASLSKTSNERPAGAHRKTLDRQRALFDQLGIKTDTVKDCVQYIAWRFIAEIGIENDTHYMGVGVPLINHNYMPDTTKDIATALTKVGKDLEIRRSLAEEGTTQNDIDAAFKIFADHINGKILANSRSIG